MGILGYSMEMDLEVPVYLWVRTRGIVWGRTLRPLYYLPPVPVDITPSYRYNTIYSPIAQGTEGGVFLQERMVGEGPGSPGAGDGYPGVQYGDGP